ncbi:phytoene desaturase family protein [Antrihabitans cavernicola]|uniref:Phytoene desaturase n=1 Tax=Antrihabitans cavernicola TaxID=2495913 RepID=A0A5A7SCU4_9NOCA|nr:phytoene desaturase family protein [Spelaeibacter cavernicola]KAA0023199.1 phytoene desaturase [Spelaeibacter cavernicola]
MGRPLRTVTGPTDHVVVVGAGLSGLAAALYLLGSGRSVTVLERADHPGGRVGVFHGSDYDIDNGATVLTMPELIDQALAAVGSDAGSVNPPLRIKQLGPSYHARFADGSVIDLHADPDAMAAEVTRACGADEAQRYLRMRRWLADVFDAEYDSFMDANFDSPLDLLSGNLVRLVRLGAFGRLGPRIGKFLHDSRLARLFTFQALYAGVSPAEALGVYGAIPHMDTSMGVYFPEGGMRAIAQALADAVTTAGGRIEFGANVTGIDVDGRRARRVNTADGRGFDCDTVVVTVDIDSVPKLFGTTTSRRRRLRASPSAVVVHGTIPVAVTDEWAAQEHHTIDFGEAWDRTFAEITARRGRGSLMSDPSLLITRPALTDAGLYIDRDGERYEPLSVLAPCPNLDSAPLQWPSLTQSYVRELLAELEKRGYTGIAAAYTVDSVDTPQTWSDQGMLAGSPFSAAHVFRQTGPFRPRNFPRATDNVVLAGCGTTPGVGVPTALISGKLAAERIIGRH